MLIKTGETIKIGKQELNLSNNITLESIFKNEQDDLKLIKQALQNINIEITLQKNLNRYEIIKIEVI